MLFARPWEKLLNTESLSIDIKPLEYFDLSNKIRVYYKKNTVLPKATFQLFIEGGAAEETEQNTGINSMWGKSVVFSGSTQYPRKKLSENLELQGSEFTFDSSLERSTFTLDSLSDHFENDLAMVMDVLKNPAFSKPDIDLIKSQVIQIIKKRTENPAQMANMAAQLIQWKNNVRGNISTLKSIEPVDDGRLKTWHKKMMSSDRFTILITGDIDPLHMKTLLDGYFKEFTASGAPYQTEKLMVSAENLQKGSQIIYHQTKDIPQTTILYRAHGIKHNDPDYYAMKLFDFLFGGDSFNSYLTNVIRVKNGWAYGVYSSYSSNAYSGNLSIFVQTQNKNVNLVLDEIDKILHNPEAIIDEGRLSAAKNSIKNSLVFMAETPETLARLQLALKWDNLPDDYLSHYVENIQKVTSDDLRRAAKKYYLPENYFISVVGPKDVVSTVSADKNTPKRTRVSFTLPE
jgi:zinc protease